MESLLTMYYQFKQQLYQVVKHIVGIPALALRFYLVPIFWMAGT